VTTRDPLWHSRSTPIHTPSPPLPVPQALSWCPEYLAYMRRQAKLELLTEAIRALDPIPLREGRPNAWWETLIARWRL